MSTPAKHFVKVIATGFVVLMLLSLPLFWLRYMCELKLVADILPSSAKEARLEPSGLVPNELENDPNVVINSFVNAGFRNEGILGVKDYFRSRFRGGHISNVYFSDWGVIYFDKSTGQLKYPYLFEQRKTDNSLSRKEFKFYIGPEGFSETPDKKLGRFTSPIVDESNSYPWLTLYDKKLRQFFRIDSDDRTVVKGPQLPKDDFHRPVEIGILRKNPNVINLNWNGPKIEPPEKNIEKGHYPSYQLESIVRLIGQGQFFLVLDETGRIDLVNRETLEFTGIAGYLPSPDTLFPGKQRVTPKDLLAYDVMPLVLNTDHQYRGMFVATVNREGTDMALYVFDKDGKTVKRSKSIYTYYTRSGREEMIPSGKAVYFHILWGPVLTIMKYSVENLHPPVLSIVSYFTADSFEAVSGHRALFVLPNSFIAMKGRDVKGNFASRFLFALLLILPSIVLSIFLTWRVGKDAAVIGLSGDERMLWILGTIAFGPVGYITYRLTRPKITLVTCQNCGKQRRPDMDRCHHCKSKWHIPELIPPTWRVVD
jgi:hypothetical protein